ncbi:hypothetical protein QVD17_36028 [Tagetes erecta]|uniref:Uncharacterized protein n=1 Tax=Tagetes erecta TaxID=13708 RepID=A0AAD8NHR6_TARER|nr:hypothetical protein QVD17_36028 [Tagetes erecta]
MQRAAYELFDQERHMAVSYWTKVAEEPSFMSDHLSVCDQHCYLVIKFISMGDTSASYIHMVQHLIEKCLIFHMTKEECMEALSKHADIKPVITSTVWNELEKENREFFKSYMQSLSDQSSSGSGRMSESETSELIQEMISEHQVDDGSKSDDK